MKFGLDGDGGGPGGAPTEPRPLVACADELLLDDVLRLSAAAGTTPLVTSAAAAARRSWSTAPLVVVSTSIAEELAAVCPARRPRVVVVDRDADDARAWMAAVRIGAEHVHVLPADEEALIDDFANCLDTAQDRATVVSIVGGCGGAGASTFAGALAVSSSRADRSTLLIDADPLGGGIDMVLGGEEVTGLRWPDLAATSGRISGRSLRAALPRMSALSVLSWDRGDVLTIPADSMRSVVTAGQRSHELVVVDVPRRMDAAAEEAVMRSDLTLLVVPAEVRAIAAAGRILGRVRPLAPELALVVRAPGPSGIGADVVVDALGLPLLATMRVDRRVAESIDEGRGPVVGHRRGPAAAADAVLAHLADRRLVREVS